MTPRLLLLQYKQEPTGSVPHNLRRHINHPAPSLSLPHRHGIQVVDDARFGQQPFEHGGKPCPRERASLAAAVEPLEQQPAGRINVATQGLAVATDAVVLDVSLEVAAQIVHHGLAALTAQLPQALIEPLELVAKPLALGLAPHHKVALAAAPDEVREAQEVEGLRAPVPILLAALRRLAAEAQHGRLARLDLQVEGRQSCGELRVKPPGVVLPLEARHEVISVPH